MTKRALTPFALSLLVLLASAAAALAAPPGNNDFPGFPLTGANVPFSGTNVDATRQPGEANHASSSESVDCEGSDPTCITSVWWHWTAPSTGTVNVNLCGSDFDTTLGVYTGSSVGSLTQAASNDDIDPTEEADEPGEDSETSGPLQCPSNRTASGVEFTAAAGTTYRIAVAGFDGSAGAIVGRISPGPLGTQPPKPGRCSNRSTGSNGRDDLIGTPFGDAISGLGGNDRIAGGRGDDCLFGNRGKDRLDGGRGRDRVFGGSGKDRVRGGSGNDVVRGDSGNDRVAGGSGKDRVVGGSGKDRIAGGSGRDRIAGGSGNDRIRARDRRRDRIDCGRGTDRVDADRSDRVRRCERVRRR